MVGLLVTGCVCRHVRQDKVGCAGQSLEELSHIIWIVDVTLHDVDTCQRFDRQEVDPGDFTGALDLGDLQPAAWRTAKVDHALATAEQVQLFIDFQQLVSSPRPIAF